MHAPSFIQLVLTGLVATPAVASFGLAAPSGLALRHVGALAVLVAPALAAPAVGPSKANRERTRRDSGAVAADRRDISEHSMANEDPEIGIRELADDSEVEARDFSALHHDGDAHAEEADASEIEAREFTALHHDGGAHAEEADAPEVEARDFSALHHDGAAHAEEADAPEVEARDFSALHHDGGAHAEEADASEIGAREFTALHHGEELDAAEIDAREIFAFDHDESETAEK